MGAADQAFERWAYGEGWAAGVLEGRRQGFEEGYGAGFDAGAEVGAARVLLGLQHALGDRLFELLPELPQAGEYAAHRQRTALIDDPCRYGCGACSRCVRAAAVATNTVLHGEPDYPGLNGTTVLRGRC